MLNPDIVRLLIDFRRDRDWEQFHSLRNLSASICIEAGELLEIFQWAKDGEMEEIISSRMEDIKAEIADIAILVSYFCHDVGIDIDDCVKAKMVANQNKYPIEKSRGVSTKYDRLV